MSLQILKDAIEQQKPISFQYNKPGKTPGKRIGNPHAVWVMRKKDGTESTKVHIVQTDGVSDSGQKLPSFRMFDLEVLSQIELLKDSNTFDISEQYKPEWDGYTFVIAKV
jgi:hypothetical protein